MVHEVTADLVLIAQMMQFLLKMLSGELLKRIHTEHMCEFDAAIRVDVTIRCTANAHVIKVEEPVETTGP